MPWPARLLGMLRAFKVGLPQRPSEKNGQKGRVCSQPSLLSSPCLRRLPQKCGALRVKPWSAVQRQTPRWREPDSNSRSRRTPGVLADAGSRLRRVLLVRGKSCRRRGRVRRDRELAPAASQHPRFLDQDFRRRATRRASFFSTQRTPQRRRDFAGPHLEFGSADRALRGADTGER